MKICEQNKKDVLIRVGTRPLNVLRASFICREDNNLNVILSCDIFKQMSQSGLNFCGTECVS